ncbi:MAG: hypothetical protein C4294_05080 [Nitrospiraceae bacterium]
MPASVCIHPDRVVSETAFFIAEGAIDQQFELIGLERLEPENLRARYERAVDIKIGIESRRPN